MAYYSYYITNLYKEQRAGSKEQSEDNSKIACLSLLIAHLYGLPLTGFSFTLFLGGQYDHYR
jgi:hypothetical protein